MAKDDNFFFRGLGESVVKQIVSFWKLVVMISLHLFGELKHKKTWILQVVNTVEEIQERHDAVKEIEKKLLDLHQVCLHEDLSLKYLI